MSKIKVGCSINGVLEVASHVCEAMLCLVPGVGSLERPRVPSPGAP